MHAECVTFVRILQSMIEVIQQEFIVNKINKGLGNWIRLGFVVRNRCLRVCIKLFIFETTCIVPSGPATGLQGSAINSTAIQLSWQPPPSDQLNGVFEFYTVTLTEIPSGVMMIYNTSSPSITIGSLVPCFTYTWDVTPFTVGYGPVSILSSVTTLPEVNGTPAMWIITIWVWFECVVIMGLSCYPVPLQLQM